MKKLLPTVVILSLILTACKTAEGYQKQLIYTSPQSSSYSTQISSSAIPTGSSPYVTSQATGSKIVLSSTGSTSKQVKSDVSSGKTSAVSTSKTSSGKASSSSNAQTSSGTVSSSINIPMPDVNSSQSSLPAPTIQEILNTYNDAVLKKSNMPAVDFEYENISITDGVESRETGSVKYNNNSVEPLFDKKSVVVVYNVNCEYFYSSGTLYKKFINFAGYFIQPYNSDELLKYVMVIDPQLTQNEIHTATLEKNNGCTVINIELSNFEKFLDVKKIVEANDIQIKALTVSYVINVDGYISSLSQSYQLEYDGVDHTFTIMQTFYNLGNTITIKPSFKIVATT